MGDLIDDILAFSHLGQSEIQRQEIDLGQLVGEVIGDFREETRDRDIDLVLADNSLPAFDGNSAAEFVHEEWPGLPLILVSGSLGTPATLARKARKLLDDEGPAPGGMAQGVPSEIVAADSGVRPIP